MKKFLCLLVLISMVTGISFSQDELPVYTKIIAKVQKELEAKLDKKGLRISIPDFNTSQKKYKKKVEIGQYLSDKMSMTLFQSKKIKIYERSKLNSILKEHKLLLSGVIDEDAVVKLGELAPVDAILFGSYLKMKKSLEITLRLVSVTSGEIEWTFSAKVALSEELESLFSGEIEVKKMTDVERINIIKSKLKNITSQDDIDQITRLLKKVPVFSNAGDIHKMVIEEYHKMKIYDTQYAKVLTAELRNIDKILNQNTLTKCTYMLYYIKTVDGFNAEEYALGLDIMKKWNKYAQHRIFVNYFFEIPEKDKTFEQRKQDIDEFLALHARGELAPLRYDDIFLDLSYLYYSKNVNSIIHDDRLVLYVMDRMYDKLTIKNKTQILSKMQNFYLNVKDDILQDRAFEYLCKAINDQKITTSLTYSIHTIGKGLEKDALGKNKNSGYRGKDLKPFIQKCKKTILKVMTELEPRNISVWKEWKSFYERNGLKIPKEY